MAINQSTDAILFFMTHKYIFVSVAIRKIRQAISFMNWNSILENPSIDPFIFVLVFAPVPKLILVELCKSNYWFVDCLLSSKSNNNNVNLITPIKLLNFKIIPHRGKKFKCIQLGIPISIVFD